MPTAVQITTCTLKVRHLFLVYSHPPIAARMYVFAQEELDHRTVPAWFLSFSAAMVPFCAFCYGHSKGVTGRVVERVVKSPVGVYGLFALPFVTLGMEKSIYDTVQAWQGINPNVRPADRGGFPSGGAGEYLVVTRECIWVAKRRVYSFAMMDLFHCQHFHRLV